MINSRRTPPSISHPKTQSQVSIDKVVESFKHHGSWVWSAEVVVFPILKGVGLQFPCAEGHYSLTPDLMEMQLLVVQVCTQQYFLEKNANCSSIFSWKKTPKNKTFRLRILNKHRWKDIQSWKHLFKYMFGAVFPTSFRLVFDKFSTILFCLGVRQGVVNGASA